jgi:hypothetical protein
MNPRLLVVATAALLALTGCGGDGTGGHASPTPSVSTETSLLELSRCMRANGYPTFPDPVQDAAGTWTLPESAQEFRDADPPACREMLRVAKRHLGPPEITASELAQQQAFATCMREHGVPGFPDPDPEGNFPLTDEQRAHEDGPVHRGAEQACQHLARPRDPGKP